MGKEIIARVMMTDFYYKKMWLPFAIDKKRILLLALVCYVALC